MNIFQQDIKILAFDLESRPNKVYTWGLFNQNISIGQIIEPTSMMCFGARWFGSNKVIFRSEYHHTKKEMLEELHRLMDEADYLVGWNSKGFDHKHINREFLENGMMPPSPTKDLDLLLLARRYFRFTSNKLDYVAKQLGVGEKVKHTGFQLWIDCMARDAKAWAMMKKYQIQDVNLLIDLYEILKPWMDNTHPNMAIATGQPQACRICASTDLRPRGHAYTSVGSYVRVLCHNCNKWDKKRGVIATSEMRQI